MSNIKVCGLMPVFNEEDIIEEVIEHHLRQDMQLIVLDDGSTDRTLSICSGYDRQGSIRLHRNRSRLGFEALLDRLADLSRVEQPDWVVVIAADEFLESGRPGETVGNAIRQAHSAGENLIQFDRFDFFLTERDPPGEASVRKRLRYYAYQDDFVYRAFRLSAFERFYTGGHLPIFRPGQRYRIWPRKLVLRHYPFRSAAQARRKIIDRMVRYPESFIPRRDFVPHYLRMLNSVFDVSVDAATLTRYAEDGQWVFTQGPAPYLERHPQREQLFSEDGRLCLEV